MNLPVWFLLCKYNALVFCFFLHLFVIYYSILYTEFCHETLLALFHCVARLGSARFRMTRHGTAQFSTVCVSTSSVQNYSHVVIIAPPLLPWLLKNFFIPPCSGYRLTIFSGQSVISRVYTSRFGNGTVRLEPGTRYCTQWITPQEWGVLNRTVL